MRYYNKINLNGTNMKKILFSALGILANQSFAGIGPTPYTLAQNIKQLNCPNSSSYVIGTTKLYHGYAGGKYVIYSTAGTSSNLKINDCEPMKEADRTVCQALTSVDLVNVRMEQPNFVDQEEAILFMQKIQGKSVEFEACVRKIFRWGKTSVEFGAFNALAKSPFTFSVLDHILVDINENP